MKEHSIVAHSLPTGRQVGPRRTSEVFALIIIKYRLSEYRANKAAQIQCPFSIRKIYG
jgi:hypothetical protein